MIVKKLGALLLCAAFSIFLTAITATAAPAAPPLQQVCVSSQFAFSGTSSATSGNVGNTRTFTVNGVSVRASGFSRTDSNGAWAKAFLGIYGSAGLGVTDGSEGDGGNNSHKVDNIGGRNNYVLFEFSSPVVVNQAFLDSIGADSDISVWIGSRTDPFNNHLTLSDALLSSFSTENNTTTATATSRWANVNAGALSGNVLVIAAEASGANLQDAFKVSKLDLQCSQPLRLTCVGATGTAGVAYSSAMVVTGGTAPYTFSLNSGSLPPGLRLIAATGVITGTPTAAGPFSFTVKVTDSRGATAASSSCGMTIAPPPTVPVPLTLLCAGTTGAVRAGYSSAMVVKGGTGPYTFSLSSGSLPPGLTLNASTGVIAGTPTTAGPFSFTARVTDSLGATATNASCGISIAPLPLTLLCAGATWAVGAGYSSAMVVTGGVGPYTFALSSGSLPSGLTLNTSTGVISGTPTTAGPHGFTVQVTDLVGATATSASCGITIAPTLTLACPANAGQVAVAYSSAAAIDGGAPPYTYSVASGALPAGLTLNTSTGAITGAPTTMGAFSFNVRVTDSFAATATSSSCGIGIITPQSPTLQPALSDLIIIKSHSGDFQLGGSGAYTLTVSNIGPAATDGTVMVSDTLPPGLTATAISGTDWNCSLTLLRCVRNDALAAGANYPPIIVMVNVASDPLIGSQSGTGLTFQPGDLLISMSDGLVQWRQQDWTLVEIITSATDGQAKGMAFDASGNLYVTHYYGSDFSGNGVEKFDRSGNLIGLFGADYDCNPSSIVFDKTGNAYVGHADCGGDIFKFDPQGNRIAQYNVTAENRGAGHIVLDPDQCTMYYTSQGSYVKRFDVCTFTQMADFNSTPLPDRLGGAHQFALLPGGGMLVANFGTIVRLDASGNLVRTFDAPADSHCWLGMALDLGGTSFWATNWCGSSATRFDMATGNVIESHMGDDIGFTVKQIIVVPGLPGIVAPPTPGRAVVINRAAVSGGGEVNISNNAASDSTTIIIPLQTP